ncbi:hypothetical protein TB1_032696 [Malus domestica]
MTSTMQTLPTQRQNWQPLLPPTPSRDLGLEWLQSQTLMKLSSEVFRVSKASAMVAETERDLRADLARQRSDTSYLKKLTAMQLQVK